LPEGENWSLYDDYDPNPPHWGWCYGITFYISADYPFSFSITNLSYDTEILFNADEYNDDVHKENYAKNIEFYNVWDLKSCMLTSSIVNNENGYLGYTNARYEPIKYYKITSYSNVFYIDLFCGHNHNIKSILPKDNKDHLSLEIVLIK
jgi:hypothetical protein